VSKQVFRRSVPQEQFGDLLPCPESSWRDYDIEVNILAPVVRKNDKNEEQPEAYRGNNEKSIEAVLCM